jgi:EAL domain
MTADAADKFPRDTLVTPLIMMINNGVPVSTFIDVGAADGTFGLTVLDAVNPNLHLFNIDAQETYAPSLSRIETMLGEPDRIAREAAQYRVDPKQIILEITETGVFRDAADTLDILARLHMKGFALSIDDFGTGYSSMEQLRRVPFAELKIDRAFVNGAAQNHKAKAILQSSANLGKSLGLSVVAEGAETQEDWDLLAALGLDVVQGYFVSKPMPVEAVREWSKDWNSKH